MEFSICFVPQFVTKPQEGMSIRGKRRSFVLEDSLIFTFTHHIKGKSLWHSSSQVHLKNDSFHQKSAIENRKN